MKRIISLILLMSILILTVGVMSSCDIASEIIGSLKDDFIDEELSADLPELSGTYLRVSGFPTPYIIFTGSKVEVKLGKRSMKGSFTLRKSGEDTYEVVFDFGNSTTLIGGIGSGTYAISVGTQKGIDYILLFGTRYDKQ
jgi:hypothetical protein